MAALRYNLRLAVFTIAHPCRAGRRFFTRTEAVAAARRHSRDLTSVNAKQRADSYDFAMNTIIRRAVVPNVIMPGGSYPTARRNGLGPASAA
jgi:hypothetical protein